jgi:osomolarity two-component system response regulator SSK1
MRRLWVKRGVNGTPASIQLQGDDLVDDLKDAVFRKYPVALARSYDAPDVSICLALPSATKANITETRPLAVDESIEVIVSTYFPKGQRVEDALVIQVPSMFHITARAQLTEGSASQGRSSPYLRQHSPLAGTLGLLTNDMRDFEYFPETPPLTNSTGQSSQQTLASSAQVQYTGSSHVAHSSRSHSASSHQRSPGSNAAFEGSVRPAPALHMSANMRNAYRLSPRPATSQQQQQQQQRQQATQANDANFYAKHSRNISQSEGDGKAAAGSQYQEPLLPPPPPRALLSSGHDRAVDSSIVSITGDDLSASGMVRPSDIIDEAAALTAKADASNNATPSRTRRTSFANGNDSVKRPVRPALGRKSTQSKVPSKMIIVSNASSPHGSTHSVVKVDQAPKMKNEAANTHGLFGPGGLLEGVVPPIVVLVVEDNMINQKILETFMKKRKIRCLTAKNGREAVDKWKKGGIHLVLMDIQMPIMSGIEATKEIRRLERINNIGVFSKKEIVTGSTNEADLLPELQLRSPVIIVALTASSLQSDRHEALAAGCNDFLTKPVSLVWLERKVFEWGCMQALIDFEGWKKFRSAAA